MHSSIIGIWSRKDQPVTIVSTLLLLEAMPRRLIAGTRNSRIKVNKTKRQHQKKSSVCGHWQTFEEGSLLSLSECGV
jgi:hypothetical protein